MSEHNHVPASVTAAYGEISVAGNSTATTVTVQNTWYQVTIFDTNGLSSGTTPDHTNDHITIATTGTYLVTVSLSLLSGSGTSDVYECAVYKNDGATQFANLIFDRQLAGGGGDVGSASISGLATLTAADTIELWIRNTSSTTDVTVENVTLSLVQIA